MTHPLHMLRSLDLATGVVVRLLLVSVLGCSSANFDIVCAFDSFSKLDLIVCRLSYRLKGSLNF